MPKTVVRKNKNLNRDGEVYLTKRLLLSIAKKAGAAAAAETMKIQGYNIIAENGCVLKVYADGTRVKLKDLPKLKRPSHIVFK